MTTPPKTGTVPPPTASRAPAGAPVAGSTEAVIVQGQPLVTPPTPTDENLSEEQLRDLSEASKTTGNTPAKPGTAATEHKPIAPNETHLHVRSLVRDSFRRAGMTFTKEPSIIPIEDIGPEKVAQLEAEPMLEVRRMRGGEADMYQRNATDFDRGLAAADPEEMRSALRSAKRRIDDLEADNLRLREKYEMSDLPPRGKGSQQENNQRGNDSRR